MKNIERSALPIFTVILLGLVPGTVTHAFDGHDGDFGISDDADMGAEPDANDGDTDNGEDGHTWHGEADGQGHHDQGEHYGRHVPDGDTDGHADGSGHNDGSGHKNGDGAGHAHHEHQHAHSWPVWGFAPAFAGFGAGNIWPGSLGIGGFGIGGFGSAGFASPGFDPIGYSLPYYPHALYYPGAVAAPSSPPLYVQKETEPGTSHQFSAGLHAGYWYYCREPEGYYPQVQECLDGWEAVPPQPARESQK